MLFGVVPTNLLRYLEWLWRDFVELLMQDMMFTYDVIDQVQSDCDCVPHINDLNHMNFIIWVTPMTDKYSIDLKVYIGQADEPSYQCNDAHCY